MSRIFVSVIIPVCVETPSLALTLIDIHHHLSRDGRAYEILVVAPSTLPQARQIVDRFAGLVPWVKLLPSAPHCSFGGAVRFGMQHARGNWRFIIPATGAVSIDEFYKLLPYLERGGCDMVLGIPERQLRFFSYLCTIPYTLIVQLLFGIPGADFSESICVVSARVGSDIFPKTVTRGPQIFLEARSIVKQSGWRLHITTITSTPLFYQSKNFSWMSVKNIIQLWINTTLRRNVSKS